MPEETRNAEVNLRPLISAATLLGIGMGGFVDGIVFHQILQLHNMLSAKVVRDTLVNVETNMVWDGLFHAFCWLTVMLGLAMLWRAGQKSEVPWSGRTLVGGMIMGWGIFNLVEGIIDHHILQLHHVIERLGLSIADYLFLLSGVIFILIGRALIRSASSDTPVSHSLPGTRMGTVKS